MRIGYHRLSSVSIMLYLYIVYIYIYIYYISIYMYVFICLSIYLTIFLVYRWQLIQVANQSFAGGWIRTISFPVIFGHIVRLLQSQFGASQSSKWLEKFDLWLAFQPEPGGQYSAKQPLAGKSLTKFLGIRSADGLAGVGKCPCLGILSITFKVAVGD